MTRTVGGTLAAAAAESVTTLGYLVTITPRSGAVKRLTNAGSDLVVGADTYLGNPGVNVGNITHEMNNPTSVDIDFPVDGDSPITRADLRAGMYDNATITVDLINYSSPNGGISRIASGKVGNVSYHDGGAAQIDFRGMWSLAMPLHIRTYGAGCPAKLGDAWCTVDILGGGWAKTATVTVVTNNKTIRISVTEPRAIDGWYANGALKFTSGDNLDLAYEVRRWRQDISQVQLWVSVRKTVTVGDTLLIYPGCDKTHDGRNGCNPKFNNIENYQGFPFLPGEDFAFGGYAADPIVNV